MDFAEFERRLTAAQSTPAVVNMPPELSPFDMLTASPTELDAAEQALGATLPPAYRWFMTTHGGGQFLFLDLVPVASTNPHGPDLVTVHRDEQIPDFVPIAPVGTGDWWGFPVHHGACADQVDFWSHDDRRRDRQHPDFLSFLSVQGLRHGV